MRNEISALLMVTLTLLTALAPLANADTLLKTDFTLGSFSKTIDFMDYARAYSSVNGLTPPPDSYHAYLDMDYINNSGLQLLYAGLENITFGGPLTFRIPMQSLIMHYKTNNQSRDVLLSSTFLMLMAFNETVNTININSPDINDTLYASFSMGYDLSSLNATLPALTSTTEMIPLTSSTDKLQWTWGMKYTNLTALWWRTWIDPANAHFDNSWPVALTVYDELAFTYNLTINKTTQTATLTENHTIGRMRHLFTGIPLLWTHYNSTGEYWLGRKVSNTTIYDYLEQNRIKMSIINFQTSIMADHETYSATPNGQNITDTETPVTGSSINTYSDDGIKISNLDFGSKNTYKLYNYTIDPTEETSTTNQATTRTTKTNGLAQDTRLFTYHIELMKFLPLVVLGMHPGLYTKAMETITNMTKANYYYLTGYGNYSGYRIEQDPTLTIYMSTTTTSTPTPINPPITIILVIAAVASIITITLLLRRKPNQKAISTPTKPQT